MPSTKFIAPSNRKLHKVCKISHLNSDQFNEIQRTLDQNLLSMKNIHAKGRDLKTCANIYILELECKIEKLEEQVSTYNKDTNYLNEEVEDNSVIFDK